MKDGASRASARPLLILGRPVDAADLTLKRVLRGKERGHPLIVVDYQGVLADQLSERNKGNLRKGPFVWCDLANRRRPIALFRFRRSLAMKVALTAFLANCSRQLAAEIPKGAIDAAAELSLRMADQGSVGLAALARGLRRPETSLPLRRDPEAARAIDRLAEMLEWMLRFPTVWSLSEGNNPIDLKAACAAGGTVWLELPAPHLERQEHRIAAAMVEAAVLHALMGEDDDVGNPPPKRAMATVVFGFPEACPSTMLVTGLVARQVGLFALTDTLPRAVAAKPWLDSGADCWVAGSVGDLPAAAHPWLLNDAERQRLGSLEAGQVWVRSGATGKAVTVLVRPPEPGATMAQGFRRESLKRLSVSPVKQFSSAISANVVPAPPNADLYQRLCTREALLAGWFRVKMNNRHSHGSDRVTIAQFGAALEAEIRQLLEELTAGRYRCRPLRTARIPKADGDTRVLRIACVRDRVAQAACLQLLEPIFDARFSAASFAYRPMRGAHHAVALVRGAIRAGKRWAVTADIRKCFDSIDHDILLRLVGDVIGDRDLIRLIRHWLTVDVIDFCDILPAERGVPQGEAISPLLANVYLDPLDKELERCAMVFARYADDYIVLCDTEAQAQAALKLMSDFLQGALRLALKPGKTQYCRVEEGVGFLGFRIGVDEVRIPADKKDRALDTARNCVEVMTSTGATSMQRCRALMDLNALIRGFRNYFLIDDAGAIRAQLADMDAAIDAFAAGRLDADPGLCFAWQWRERLQPRDDEPDLRQEAEAQALTGAYPLEHPARVVDEDSPRTQAGREGAVASPPAAGAAAPKIPAESGASFDPDVLVMDGRLHIMTGGCYVTVSGEDLVVRRRKEEIFRTPMATLSMAYLEGKGIAISADLTMQLCDRGVSVVFTPLIGIPSAVAQPTQGMRSDLRRQQALRRNDPEMLRVGLDMLAAKVANQASVL
ncbi:MAG: reverse transcriptase domain-containing protein, partial [Burkholderiales bacterium]